jgi:hypothetical protein
LCVSFKERTAAMIFSPPLDTSALPAPFQAGYIAGQKEARRHLKRNRVLDDLDGLTAFAADAALLCAPEKGPKPRPDLVTGYMDGYIQGYRNISGH